MTSYPRSPSFSANLNRYAKKAQELKSVSLESAIETVKKLEMKLTEFAKKHKKEIQNDPLVRAKFLEMCGPLGVDPLSSKKGFWGNMIGIGDFYYELSVKVAEVCIASRSRNGGIISVDEVKQILCKRDTRFRFSSSKNNMNDNNRKEIEKNSEKTYSTKDIVTAMSKLSKLGSGFRIVSVGTTPMIISVPMELDYDHTEIMKIAQQAGKVTMEEVIENTGWKEERAKRAIELLMTNGMAWLDIHEGQQIFWFPR